jgi:hypothetical protein
MGKAYRAWLDSDFTGADPKVYYAVITVNRKTALSETSLISLTGNSDCCEGNLCKSAECWRNPAAIKYNGNVPNSDFTFMMPCAEMEDEWAYYRFCEGQNQFDWIKIRPENGTAPQFIVFFNCFQRAYPDERIKVDIPEVHQWYENEPCAEVCGTA